MRRILNDRVLNMVIVLIHTIYSLSIQSMSMSSFFKHVKLHEYDITDKGITQACYDEMKADGYDIVITEKEMQVLASNRCEEFKNYMRPLFA